MGRETRRGWRGIPVAYRDSAADGLRGLDAAADFYLAKSEFSEDALVRVVVDLIGVARPPAR